MDEYTIRLKNYLEQRIHILNTRLDEIYKNADGIEDPITWPQTCEVRNTIRELVNVATEMDIIIDITLLFREHFLRQKYNYSPVINT